MDKKSAAFGAIILVLLLLLLFGRRGTATALIKARAISLAPTTITNYKVEPFQLPAVSGFAPKANFDWYNGMPCDVIPAPTNIIVEDQYPPSQRPQLQYVYLDTPPGPPPKPHNWGFDFDGLTRTQAGWQKLLNYDVWKDNPTVRADLDKRIAGYMQASQIQLGVLEGAITSVPPDWDNSIIVGGANGGGGTLSQLIADVKNGNVNFVYQMNLQAGQQYKLAPDQNYFGAPNPSAPPAVYQPIQGTSAPLLPGLANGSSILNVGFRK